MKFCERHWTALRDEIENKQGLAQLVSRSGKELFARVTDPGTDHHPLGETGDPLMDAHNLIFTNAMKMLSDNRIDPLFMLTSRPDGGDYCPLCVISDCDDPNCPNDCRSRDARFIALAGKSVAERYAEAMKAMVQ